MLTPSLKQQVIVKLWNISLNKLTRRTHVSLSCPPNSFVWAQHGWTQKFVHRGNFAQSLEFYREPKYINLDTDLLQPRLLAGGHHSTCSHQTPAVNFQINMHLVLVSFTPSLNLYTHCVSCMPYTSNSGKSINIFQFPTTLKEMFLSFLLFSENGSMCLTVAYLTDRIEIQ